ncbi:MAG TPA: hypothetical protein VGD17_06450 [Chitinophagaceae bacterium]
MPKEFVKSLFRYIFTLQANEIRFLEKPEIESRSRKTRPESKPGKPDLEPDPKKNQSQNPKSDFEQLIRKDPPSCEKRDPLVPDE